MSQRDIRIEIDALTPTGAYIPLGDFAQYAVSAAKIRDRIDNSAFEPGVSVLENIRFTFRGVDTRLAAASIPESEFGAGLREKARVSLFVDNALRWRGFVKDAKSPYNVQNNEQTIFAVSAGAIIRDERPPPGVLGNGRPWTDTIRSLLAGLDYALTFDGDFDALRAAPHPFDIDALRVMNAASLADQSRYDALAALLAPVRGVAIIAPDGSVRLAHRDAATDADPIVLTDETATNMELESGAQRAARRVTVPFTAFAEDGSTIRGETTRTTDDQGGVATISTDTEWLGGEGLANLVGDYILQSAAPLRREVKVSWSDQFGVPALLDRVHLNFGVGGALLDGSVSLDGEGAPLADDPNSALAGEYRAFDITHDLANGVVTAIIKT